MPIPDNCTQGTYGGRLNYFAVALLVAFWMLSVVAEYWPEQKHEQSTPHQRLSEAALRTAFRENQSDLIVLRQMLVRDRVIQVTRDMGIADSHSTAASGKAASLQQLSPNQVEVYLGIMRRAGIWGVHRDNVTNHDVKFETCDDEYDGGDITRGYEYADAAPEPLVEKLNSDFDSFYLHQDNWCEYVKLAPNWYLYQSYRRSNAPLHAIGSHTTG